MLFARAPFWVRCGHLGLVPGVGVPCCRWSSFGFCMYSHLPDGWSLSVWLVGWLVPHLVLHPPPPHQHAFIVLPAVAHARACSCRTFWPWRFTLFVRCSSHRPSPCTAATFYHTFWRFFVGVYDVANNQFCCSLTFVEQRRCAAFWFVITAACLLLAFRNPTPIPA